MKRMVAKVLAVGFLLTGFAWAQEDEPGRGVARISLMNGDVSVRRGDSGDYVAAAVNAPLVVQDQVITGPGSRAEVQFDSANLIRLSSDAEVRLAELENRRYQVQVARGTVTFRVLRDSDAEVEINTPSVSVRPTRNGTYRMAVLENGDSEITVRSGEAEVYSPRGVEKLRPGRTMLARGSASDPEFQVVGAIQTDDWDRWNERRDRDFERSRSYEYVSRDVYGADELDSYGSWVNVAPYGMVWSPRGVGYDWAPYRAGRWVWVDWYGWTWVSSEPWGWAPYHYGRWFNSGPHGWCWFPGSMHQRHHWSPALVGFFGWGGHGGVGVGFGSIGWVPLAPYETYHPWYGGGRYRGYRNTTYIDNSVRVVNNVNITNVYRNARVVNGISGIDSQDFGRGRGGRIMRVTDPNIRNVALMQGSVPVTPSAASLRMSDRQVSNMPRAAATERFYSRRPAPQVERVPFEQQRQGMERMVQRTYGGSQQATGVGNMPRGGSGRGTAAMEPVRQQGSVVTLPRPGGTARPEAAAPAGNLPRATAGGEGWRRFGGSGTQGDTGNAPARLPRSERMDRAVETAPADASRTERQNDSGSNWRRFGGSQGTERPARQSETPRVDRSQSTDTPRHEAPAPVQRFSAPRTERSEPIHINPPIVRERGGGEVRSAPAAAPRSESRGGGGGTSRSESSRSESRGRGR